MTRSLNKDFRGGMKCVFITKACNASELPYQSVMYGKGFLNCREVTDHSASNSLSLRFLSTLAL